ncbi:MAG: response regulator [Pseudomonadota bacterium]
MPTNRPVILIAEDNEPNRELIQRRLERRGYIAAVVCNGREAVDYVLREPPDVILMDLEMPVMSGFDALQAIRDLEAAPNCPCFALTAHATAEIRRRCEMAGFDAFLTKPIDFKELINVLGEFDVLEPRRAQGA